MIRGADRQLQYGDKGRLHFDVQPPIPILKWPSFRRQLQESRAIPTVVEITGHIPGASISVKAFELDFQFNASRPSRVYDLFPTPYLEVLNGVTYYLYLTDAQTITGAGFPRSDYSLLSTAGDLADAVELGLEYTTNAAGSAVNNLIPSWAKFGLVAVAVVAVAVFVFANSKRV